LLEKFKEQLFSYGVDIFVIDAFNKVAMPSGNRLDAINDVLTKLTSFAQANDVIIFLVAHPTKMKKNDAGIYEVPSLYDVSGSADFRNQTHDGFTVYRKFESKETGEEDCTEIYNMKTKYKFQGEIGERVEFLYDLPTGRYYEKGTNPPRFDMTKPWEEQTIAPTAMRPNETFALQDIDYDEEDEQDAPF